MVMGDFNMSLVLRPYPIFASVQYANNLTHILPHGEQFETRTKTMGSNLKFHKVRPVSHTEVMSEEIYEHNEKSILQTVLTMHALLVAC